MIKVSLVVLAGLVAAGSLRARSASTRHWVLAWTLACAAVIPALELVVPSWNAPVSLPWMSPPASDSRLAFGDEAAAVDAAASRGGSGATASSPWLPRWSLLRQTWIAGVAASLWLLAVGFVRLTRIVSRAVPLERGAWVRALTDLAGSSSHTPVRLVVSQHPAALFTWGLWRPAIVLPAGAPAWPSDRIRAVLAHELAHVRRRDWAVQSLAELLRCVHWFNPLVWFACHRLRQTSEQACDDVVLSAGLRAPEYAAHLLDVARLFSQSGRPSCLPVMTIMRPSSLERRVRTMLRSGVNRSPISGPASLATASALLMLTIPLAGLTPGPPPPSAAMIAAERGAAGDGAAPGEAPQATPTTLTGTIRDALGRTMPDVVVHIAAVATPDGPKPQIRTGPDGRFQVTGLPPGEYEVSSVKPGFKRNLLRAPLRPGVPATLDIVLQIGSLTETIVITGSRDAASPSTHPVPAQARPSQPGPTGADPCDNSPVGGCVTPPRKLVDVKPSYPPALAASGVSADVVVKATLGTDGFLKDFQPDAGPDAAFVEAVLEAMRRWQFTPVRLNGVPQECQVTVNAQFVAGK